MKMLLAIGPSPQIGGGQKVFLTFVEEFMARKHEVIAVVPDGPLVDYIKALNIKFYIVNYNSVACLSTIYRILRKEKVDIINTFLTKCSLFFAFANLFFGNTICCTLLNAIIHEKLNNVQKLIYPKLYFLLHKMCDGIIVNSGQNRRHFMEVAGIDGNSIKVIYSGIDMRPFIIADDLKTHKNKVVIGVVGRLSKEKGHIYLIEALTYLHGLDYECLIVGDGPLRKELEQHVQGSGLQDKVRFLGFQEHVAVLMQQMDVIIVPSLNETFGITIVEAFALKKFVIASDVGGIPELVQHKITGWLFPVRDSAALAESISHFCANRDEGRKIAENAYKFALGNFTSAIMADNTISFYNYLTKTKGRT